VKLVIGSAELFIVCHLLILSQHAFLGGHQAAQPIECRILVCIAVGVLMDMFAIVLIVRRTE
jgi:hypothetical protein